MKIRTSFFFFLWVWGACASVEAQRSYALLVGINQYRHHNADPEDRVTHLMQAVSDVRKMQAFLPRIGFPAKDTVVLLDEGATKEAVQRALRELAKKADRKDRVLFYFSGHGYQISEVESSFVLHDTTRRDNASHLTGTEFQAWAKTLRTQKALFLFDCCHAGGLISGARGSCPSRALARYIPNREMESRMLKSSPKERIQARQTMLSRALRVRMRSSAYLAWSAARYDQVACESGTDQGGVFTTLFLRAAAEILDSKAAATFFDLNKKLSALFNQHPYSLYKAVQSPRLAGDPHKPLFFLQASTKPPKEQASNQGCHPQSKLCLRLWVALHRSQKRGGFRIEGAASKTSPKETRFAIGQRIRFSFRVNQASRISLFIRPSDGKTRTALKDFIAKAGQVYDFPPNVRQFLEVSGPPGPIQITAEAWPIKGARGDLLLKSEDDEMQTPAVRRPARTSLLIRAIQP
jgi:hypothetical protein